MCVSDVRMVNVCLISFRLHCDVYVDVDVYVHVRIVCVCDCHPTNCRCHPQFKTVFKFKQQSLACCDEDGTYAMHIAAAEGNLEIVKFLIAEGFDVQKADKDQWTPLLHGTCGGKSASSECGVSPCGLCCVSFLCIVYGGACVCVLRILSVYCVWWRVCVCVSMCLYLSVWLCVRECASL